MVDQSDDNAHTGGQCTCVTDANWNHQASKCICADGLYTDGNSCSECSAIPANDDPLIEKTTPSHIDGICDCVNDAEWDSEAMVCVCLDGYYANNNACDNCNAGGDPLIEMNNPEHLDGICDCI